MNGKVLWWDKRDGRGIIQDASGNEYYVDSSVLTNAFWLDRGDEVAFKSRTLGGTLCAYDVTWSCGGEHDPYQAEDCQECCPHDLIDHHQCADCGKEFDPGADIDRAMDSLEDR